MDCPKCNLAAPEGALFCPYCGRKLVKERKKRKRPNGMGTVWKKSGNRTKPWEAQKAGIYVGSYATKYEAEQALRALDGVRISDRLNLTFGEIYDRWLKEHSRTVSASAMRDYAAAYSRCGELHGKVFRSLRASDFQSVLMELEDKNYSRSSCNKQIQLFSMLSEWAIREEICRVNYARFVTTTVKEESKRTAFTPDQIAAIAASPLPAAQVVMILLSTGCRPNELFKAATADCHETYFVSGSKTEAGKDRLIPVAPFGLPFYQALRDKAIAGNCAKLLDAYTGSRSQALFTARDWPALMQSLGITGMTPYNCRHTYTTMAVQSGLRPEILQRILGHANYSTTVEVYTHLGAEDILSEAAKLSPKKK